MSDCIFCNIASGAIPSHTVYEDATTYAFLDNNPLHEGHLLVIPIPHSTDALSMDTPSYIDLQRTVHKLAHAVRSATHADGINIVLNCGKGAGQEVFHTHVHIIPRFLDDGFHWWPGHPYEKGVAEHAVQAIKNHLA